MSIDPEKIEVTSNYSASTKVLTSMMDFKFTQSFYPLGKKLFPMWKRRLDTHAYKLIPLLRRLADATTIKEWLGEIAAEIAAGLVKYRFLYFYSYDLRKLRKDLTPFHVLFEGGTDDHVEMLSTITNDNHDDAVHVRWLLPWAWSKYSGPTRSQAWEPMMDRLVVVATTETVERILKPESLLGRHCSQSVDSHSDLIHFLFANGEAENVIKLLEIVDATGGCARKMREGLLKLYKAYNCSVKGKEAWTVVIGRLEALEAKAAAGEEKT